MSELDTPFALMRAYDDGLNGYVPDEREKQDFLGSQKYGFFNEPNIRGSGIGKRALLWQYCLQLDPLAFTERQTTGDCFVAGTLVRMGDGTEKPIESLSSGDVVASPFGGVQRVLSTFSKKYSGTVRTITAEGCADSITSTPDHRFVSFASRYEWSWLASEGLAVGGRVFTPSTDIEDPPKTGGRASTVWRVAGGFAPRIKAVHDKPFDGPVYCIEVEHDHAFVANGYAVHNCVSHGSRNARDITRAVEILVKREPEAWFKRGATEPTYGARGHGGQGMSPARASRFERDTGFLARTDYDIVDLSKYDSRIGERWGRTGVPKEVQDLCAKNKVGRITLVRTQEELMDALYNGYAAHSGQSAGWAAAPNSKNVHPRGRSWNHDMAIVGYDDTKEHWPFRVWFIANSWGPWNQPIKDWPKGYPPQVPGMIVTTAQDFDVCVSSGDCWVYGSIDGYPPQHLPDYGAIGMLRHD